MLITVEKAKLDPPPEPLDGCDHIVSLSSDHPAAAKEFLAHWHPELCLWTGGDLMPNLVSATADANLPMILLDVGESDFPARRYSWFPDLTRPSFACFSTILTNSEAAARLVRRVGLPGTVIKVTDRLRNSATPPPCSDDELNELTRDVSGRPVWLAAHVTEGEFDAILTAHQTALRLLHRLLLIIVTDKTADAEALKDHIAGKKLRCVDWDTGDTIDDTTQVLLSRDEDNLGLWYRVAPVTFMARSLTADAAGASPLEAAALGSAVLYGNHVRDHMEAYARLAAAGAARSVRDGESLGSAVIQLSAPDHAAAMALAGWEVVTEGSQLTDNLVDLILDYLDQRESSDASS